MSRIFGALVALFLCLAPASAQTCISVDSLLERINENRRDYRIVEAGSTLERLKQMFAEASPASEPPPATRAIVIDYSRGVVIVYIVQDMACSPLVIGESLEAREVRALVFGERI